MAKRNRNGAGGSACGETVSQQQWRNWHLESVAGMAKLSI